jgi:hypothetical protein
MTTARIAIPTVLAVLVILFLVKAVGITPAVAESSPEPETVATPYSADHARIPDNPGPPQEPAPTF